MATNNLIFSRNANDSVLSFADVLSKAPAAYAAGHAEGLSARYGDISTLQAMDMLGGYGWLPVQAAQKRTKNIDGRQFAGHMLAFANPNHPGIEGQERPEIVLYNSHNGSSSLRLFAGMYRFICSNGIVAGDGFEVRLRHTKNNALDFEGMLLSTLETMPAMFDTVARLKSVQLTPGQIVELARRAASIRWEAFPGEILDLVKPGAYYTDYTVYELTHARRYGDHMADAWSVFNRIQEGLIRGGATIKSVTEAKPYGMPRKAKAIGSVSENIRVNRELWNMTLDLAEIEPVAV